MSATTKSASRFSKASTGTGWFAEGPLPHHPGPVLRGDVGVPFRAGQRAFLGDDPLGGDEPGVVAFDQLGRGAKITQGAQGVVAGQV